MRRWRVLKALLRSECRRTHDCTRKRPLLVCVFVHIYIYIYTYVHIRYNRCNRCIMSMIPVRRLDINPVYVCCVWCSVLQCVAVCCSVLQCQPCMQIRCKPCIYVFSIPAVSYVRIWELVNMGTCEM